MCFVGQIDQVNAISWNKLKSTVFRPPFFDPDVNIMLATLCWWQFNSHDTAGEKCVEIVKTLHVNFFPLAFP